jgi:acyl-CoA oxidase
MLQTIAKYDKITKTFDLFTPTVSATKMYIGNGMDAVHAIVFARLVIGEKDHGVHPFIVRLREYTRGPTRPGVKIQDW